MTAALPVRIAAALLPAIIVAGCAVGPDFKRPAPPEVTRYTAEPLPAAEGQQFDPAMDIPAEWWRLFGSAPLNGLIGRALANNPDLAAAEASLTEARENYLAGRGTLFPSIDAKLSATRQKTSGSQFGRPGAAGSKFTLYNASVGVTYGLDLFGLDRRQLEALRAAEEQQRFQLEAAYLTLAGNVVTAAIREASLRGQVEATGEIIADQRRQLAIVQRRHAIGSASLAEVLAQQSALAQSESTLPPLAKQQALLEHQLAALTGGFPATAELPELALDGLKLPQRLPLTLPSRLVEQRPDIRAAEALLHEASAGIGVATANMLPQITLSAAYGVVDTRAGTLFSPGNVVWNLGASLLQPVFRGGTLLHERRAAVAAYKRAAALYRATVLAAFREVADSLRALESDADAVRANERARQAAEKSLAIARDQFAAGAIGLPLLLDAQRSYQQARLGLLQARADRLTDSAALMQALGGGWWNRAGRDAKTEQRSEKP